MLEKKQQTGNIEQIDFAPSMPYELDLEIFSFSNLKERDYRKKRQLTHRYTFNMLICVTQGTCTHTIDFKPIHAQAGSLLFLRSSQAHNFGTNDDWEGWLLLFKPEFLLPLQTTALDLSDTYENLPACLQLENNDCQKIIDLMIQMKQDVMINALSKNMNALLRYQFYTLLLRLSIFHNRYATPTKFNTNASQRFKEFQRLVEKNFIEHHQVAHYAKQLKCSEKSLMRATMEIIGKNPKAFITSRIILEAKRLLAHTDLTIASIAENLGFKEPTNFIKCFKRETCITPKEFQLQYTK